MEKEILVEGIEMNVIGSGYGYILCQSEMIINLKSGFTLKPNHVVFINNDDLSVYAIYTGSYYYDGRKSIYRAFFFEDDSFKEEVIFNEYIGEIIKSLDMEQNYCFYLNKYDDVYYINEELEEGMYHFTFNEENELISIKDNYRKEIRFDERRILFDSYINNDFKSISSIDLDSEDIEGVYDTNIENICVAVYNYGYDYYSDEYDYGYELIRMEEK